MPEVGFFELYPSLRPALPAGAYDLAADHDLVASPPDGTGELAVDGSDFFFSIVSPLYTMPPDQILSTFPPASAVGDWHQRLPQIVFKRRTLPWERNPDHTKPFDTAPPWLALVVLAEGEGTLSGDVPVAQCVTAGTAIDGDADTSTGKYLEVRQSIVDTIFPTIEDLTLLAHVRKVNLEDTELALHDDDGYLSVVVANRLPQPGPPSPEGPLTSKRYTAFLINVQGQLGSLPKKEQTQTELTFKLDMPELLQPELFAPADPRPADVVVMKGIQSAGVFAHGAGAAGAADHVRALTSRGAEQSAAGYAIGPMKDSAVSSSDSRQVAEWQSGVGLSELSELSSIIGTIQVDLLLRFPVLVSWEFVCSGEGTFEQLMQGLHSAMLTTEDPKGDPALAPETSPTGHIALAAKTRRGEETTIWYRGPFVPQPTVRDGPGPDGTLPIAHTGDQLRKVVPDGREDLATASAFEIGRLLALSKPNLVADLMAWRNELFGAARVQQLSIEFFDGVVAGFSAAALAGKRQLEDLVASAVMPAYAERAPSIPAVNPFPIARTPQVLEQFDADQVLVGLGLQPKLVRQATKQSGLQGLSGLAVSTTELSVDPLSKSPAGLAAIRSGLDVHLDRLATEALHLDVAPVIGGPVPKGGRRKRRPPDALDRLITGAGRQEDGEVRS